MLFGINVPFSCRYWVLRNQEQQQNSKEIDYQQIGSANHKLLISNGDHTDDDDAEATTSINGEPLASFTPVEPVGPVGIKNGVQ